MTIKSLLFGSAAALTIATGAQAADVVVAQPEPVEYVKVCDAYGAGFFYIPGTDTCIQFSGYVWAQLSTASTGQTAGYYGPADSLGWSERVRLNVDVKSETELGTLRGFFRFQGDDSGSANGDINTAFEQAFIDFAGFRMGYTDSAWSATAVGGGIPDWGSHSWGGMYYGWTKQDLISYNFEKNGFFGTISLENDANANYMPDVVGVLGYTAGWGGVWGKIAYDEDNTYGTDAWAALIGTQINIPKMEGSSLRVIGYWNNRDGMYGTNSPFGYTLGTYGQANWSVMGSYNQQFNDKFSASVAVQYWNDFYDPTSIGGSGKTGLNGWGAELSLVYLPVTNFEIRTEIHYDKVDTISGTTSGFLRFTRYF